jgi:hypothetical protein
MPAPKTTPQERAQAQVDVLDRKIERVVARLEQAQLSQRVATAELADLERQREYAAAHPALARETGVELQEVAQSYPEEPLVRETAETDTDEA